MVSKQSIKQAKPVILKFSLMPAYCFSPGSTAFLRHDCRSMGGWRTEYKHFLPGYNSKSGRRC
jgi:hypothetical protein